MHSSTDMEKDVAVMRMEMIMEIAVATNMNTIIPTDMSIFIPKKVSKVTCITDMVRLARMHQG
jgi:hypothetical protein